MSKQQPDGIDSKIDGLPQTAGADDSRLPGTR